MISQGWLSIFPHTHHKTVEEFKTCCINKARLCLLVNESKYKVKSCFLIDKHGEAYQQSCFKQTQKLLTRGFPSSHCTASWCFCLAFVCDQKRTTTTLPHPTIHLVSFRYLLSSMRQEPPFQKLWREPEYQKQTDSYCLLESFLLKEKNFFQIHPGGCMSRGRYLSVQPRVLAHVVLVQ